MFTSCLAALALEVSRASLIQILINAPAQVGDFLLDLRFYLFNQLGAVSISIDQMVALRFQNHAFFPEGKTTMLCARHG